MIESDRFPFEFLSLLARRESWRKEIHRPIYHVHKWWAKRLGTVFRGLALASFLREDEDLEASFHCKTDLSPGVVFDPFMGSGTTIGEAHKLGLTALGRDINPVAVESVRVAMSQLDVRELRHAFSEVSRRTEGRIRDLYSTVDGEGRPAEVLYFFWVMLAACPFCKEDVDLFNSWIRAKNAYPRKKPEVQIVCPQCAAWFQGNYTDNSAMCPDCELIFNPRNGTVKRATATCLGCGESFRVRDAVTSRECTPPRFRLYGKLALNERGEKRYLAASDDDHDSYRKCVTLLGQELAREGFKLPTTALSDGYNTRQAMKYGFRRWSDFFNARQLLSLGWLHEAIDGLQEGNSRDALFALFSGVLEFNNMFASYKGEGTGAVRHMFSHHVLKPERTPIEANVWGTTKSSGSFAGLFRSRLIRAAQYQRAPTEVRSKSNGHAPSVCSLPFTGEVREWDTLETPKRRAIYLSCGDSADSELASESVDLVLTDPPFFDNVHYSELADFFYAWQQLSPRGFINDLGSTRSTLEVQDANADRFALKLRAVFTEACRVLKNDGLLVFTYHHSRDEGWRALAEAIFGAGFYVVNAHPIRAEMSVATPKSQAKTPIQLDIAVVCRKGEGDEGITSRSEAVLSANRKILRLSEVGFELSRNDRMIVLLGEFLASSRTVGEFDELASLVEEDLSRVGWEPDASASMSNRRDEANVSRTT